MVNNMRKALGLTLCSLMLLSCRASYKRDTIKESIKELAKEQYKLDVEVKEAGETIVVQFEVKNFMGELVASDQKIWSEIENVLEVLSRVALSSDRPPQFMVLDVVDADHYNTHLYFTRYVQDLQKIMAEGLSRND